MRSENPRSAFVSLLTAALLLCAGPPLSAQASEAARAVSEVREPPVETRSFGELAEGPYDRSGGDEPNRGGEGGARPGGR